MGVKGPEVEGWFSSEEEEEEEGVKFGPVPGKLAG